MTALSLGVQDGAKVVMSQAARETHLHVVGTSGQGKSYFLEHMIRQDILNGSGVCLIDPHGEIYDNIVAWLAEKQMDRYRTIHLVNPSDENWSVGFNPLCVGEDDPTVRVGAMVNACLKVWGGADLGDTPRLAKCLRSVFYVLAHQRLSLLEAKQLTNYSAMAARERLTHDLPNVAFLEEWQEFNAYPPREFQNYFESTNSRLLPFISSPIVARMVGQTEQVIDFTRCMNGRHIVLVNLATKKKVAEADSQLLGAMLFADLFASAKGRSVEEGKRSPFYCYLDECADYLTEDIARMLDQTRKFGLHLVLAHQRLAQLREHSENLLDAVMAGAQSKVVFKVDEDKTADELGRYLYRKELDLEEPKKILNKPVAVGQLPIWLYAESETESYAESEMSGQSENSGTVIGGSSGTTIHTNPDGNETASTTSEGSSEIQSMSSGSFHAHSVTHGSARSHGRSQGLKTQYEEMPTAVYSLEEQFHKAIVAVRSLPKRTALGYMVDKGKPFRFSTSTIRKGAVWPSQVSYFIERVHRVSPFSNDTATVNARIAHRRTMVIEGTPVEEEGDPFTIRSLEPVIE